MALQPVNAADHALASDLGRKSGRDVFDAITRTFGLAETPYQREVIALSGAVAAIAFARNALRLGSAPDATDRDLIEALVEMTADRPAQ